MRLYGLTPEQLGAILRLATDNQGFEDEPPAAQPDLRVIDGGRKDVAPARHPAAVDDLRGKIAGLG